MNKVIRTVSSSLLEYIKEELERIEFGEVKIILQGNSNKIDVLTQERQRFDDIKK